MEFIVFCNQGRCLNLMLILVDFLVFGAKNQGGWSNSQGKNRKTKPLCILEFLSGFFNLAKFHPNWRDGMYHPCLVLWWTRS